MLMGGPRRYLPLPVFSGLCQRDSLRFAGRAYSTTKTVESDRMTPITPNIPSTLAARRPVKTEEGQEMLSGSPRLLLLRLSPRRPHRGMLSGLPYLLAPFPECPVNFNHALLPSPWWPQAGTLGFARCFVRRQRPCDGFPARECQASAKLWTCHISCSP